MMQEVEVLKTIPELVCSYFSEEQFTLSGFLLIVDGFRGNRYNGGRNFNQKWRVFHECKCSNSGITECNER